MNPWKPAARLARISARVVCGRNDRPARGWRGVASGLQRRQRMKARQIQVDQNEVDIALCLDLGERLQKVACLEQFRVREIRLDEATQAHAVNAAFVHKQDTRHLFTYAPS